jgi:cholesterol transport system auxiliary component
MTHIPLRAVLVLGCGLGLAGCVSLLPSSKPVDLYRFGLPDSAAASAAVRSVSVRLANGAFAGAAAGDGIMTVTGDRVAAVAGGRWADPAQVLFGDAVSATFAASPGQARLLRRGDPGLADYVLSLDVQRFETRYAVAGPAPSVQVTVRALLVRSRDQAVIGDTIFQAVTPAAENRIPAIVAAYDDAVGQTLSGLAGWVQQRLGDAP